MATINSIRKQIETANKRIENFNAKIAMYETRTNNAIAKAIKVTGITNITVENFREILNTLDNWEWKCKIANAVDYKKENEKYLAREIRNVEGLTAELAKMEQAAAAKEQAAAPLKAALVVAMSNFKPVWFGRMNNWYSNHYDFMRRALVPAQARREKARKIENRLWAQYRWYEHRGIRQMITTIIRNCNEIICDDANRMNKPEYMAMINEMLEKTWAAGIDKLTDKCRTFGVDESKIKANYPDVTEKGFSVILTDGKTRVIDARVIWAAEYSEIVTPHTRYIVTERR